MMCRPFEESLNQNGSATMKRISNRYMCVGPETWHVFGSSEIDVWQECWKIPNCYTGSEQILKPMRMLWKVRALSADLKTLFLRRARYYRMWKYMLAKLATCPDRSK